MVSIMTLFRLSMRPVCHPVDEFRQRIDQFAANGAAQAPVGKLDHAIRSLFDQQMIDRHVAEFIDDHRRIGKGGVLQQAVEQRRFAGAEKTGQHGYRDWKIGHGQPPAWDAFAVRRVVAALPAGVLEAV